MFDRNLADLHVCGYRGARLTRVDEQKVEQ